MILLISQNLFDILWYYVVLFCWLKPVCINPSKTLPLSSATLTFKDMFIFRYYLYLVILCNFRTQIFVYLFYTVFLITVNSFILVDKISQGFCFFLFHECLMTYCRRYALLTNAFRDCLSAHSHITSRNPTLNVNSFNRRLCFCFQVVTFCIPRHTVLVRNRYVAAFHMYGSTSITQIDYTYWRSKQ